MLFKLYAPKYKQTAIYKYHQSELTNNQDEDKRNSITRNKESKKNQIQTTLHT